MINYKIIQMIYFNKLSKNNDLILSSGFCLGQWNMNVKYEWIILSEIDAVLFMLKNLEITPLLKLNEASPVCLPNYNMSNELNKKVLIQKCLEDNELSKYLPDSPNLNAISRDFFLSVKYICNNIVNICKEKRFMG